MATFLGKLVLVTLLFGVVEAGVDVVKAEAPAENGRTHHINSQTREYSDDPPENHATA
jgi:hypothetical protein